MSLDSSLKPAALIFAIVAIARRKEDIGGWLLYFYYWIIAVVVVLVRNVALHWNAYQLFDGQGAVNPGALYLAVFPRLLASAAVMIVALVLLREREITWLERLRTFLLAAVIVSIFSIWIDFRYFPNSVLPNGARLIGLVLWLIYFHVSVRVHRVFYAKV